MTYLVRLLADGLVMAVRLGAAGKEDDGGEGWIPAVAVSSSSLSLPSGRL